MVLETTRLFLVVPEMKMAPAILSYLTINRKFFEPWTPIQEEDFYTLAKQRELLEKDIECIAAGSQLKLYLSLKNAPLEIIGDINFSNILYGTFMSAPVGYKLALKENKQGLMTEALVHAVHHVFNSPGLHRVEANIIPHNTASIRVAEKSGFVLEGFSKKYLKIILYIGL